MSYTLKATGSLFDIELNFSDEMLTDIGVHIIANKGKPFSYTPIMVVIVPKDKLQCTCPAGTSCPYHCKRG